MLVSAPAASRELKTVALAADLVVVGGGLAGTCCAITAAREGLRVILVQDRPVLGGNASSEVRLWTLGATSHMGNNNRWAREGGVIDELLVENGWRNPEGNPVIFDTVLLEKAAAEPRLTLLLNTAVHAAEKHPGTERLAAVRAFCPQNATAYELRAPLFCDASGDGILGFLAGAAFRMGAEAREEFDEKFAPDTAAYGELLGHTIYFYSKDTGRPVTYVPPAYALTDLGDIPKFRKWGARDHGCFFWWIEYGGRRDTIHETEAIKWELWRVVYGIWNHIKNSGQFPEAANLTLEWVGTIPGKRESRRFEGDYMLNQRDVIGQRAFADAVAFGGWSIDLHPADGVYSPRKPCNQWHARGIYGIPLRCFYSRNLDNLLLAGRIISASHVAFGSTRVMATAAHGGQAVAFAAKHCLRHGVAPRDLLEPARLAALRTDLLRSGQFLPRTPRHDPADLATTATITASSSLRLAGFTTGAAPLRLDHGCAQLLPVAAGPVPRVEFIADVAESTTLVAELRTSDHPENHTPDRCLGRHEFALAPGAGQRLALDFAAGLVLDAPRYLFFLVHANPAVSLHQSEQRVTGVLSVAKRENRAVGNTGEQIPDGDIGVERFEFWIPARRPAGRNLACTITPPLAAFAPESVTDGVTRPTDRPHAWVADPADPAPTLTLAWGEPQVLGRIVVSFDPDWDHPLESTLWGHPERASPFCVRSASLRDDTGRVIAELTDNHQARWVVDPATPLHTRSLTLAVGPTHGGCPPAVFEIACFAPAISPTP